ncbi:hypothetical protein GCK32_007683 [Trichostrongylus colubriformis]|uniref:Uncharacterized protein n=1 Tax=Trichostrongylus colubriformis TaxID=6319 RepID=A0AAN8FQY0_TRICO
MCEQPAANAIETPAEHSLAPSAKVEKVAVSSSPEREKILSVKVRTNPTVFRIEYTSHDELYRLFQEKLQGLGIPPDHVYWLNTMTGERIRVNRDIAEASFFSWMNLVQLYSPVRPKKQRSTSSRRHPRNSKARHCSPDFSSSCSDECVHLRDLFQQLHDMGKCSEPAGSVFITVQQSCLHVLKIAYKDEEELFTRFSDWLKALNVRIDNLYGLDRDWERIPINDPLHLFTLASGADVLNLYNKTASDDYNYCSKRNHPSKRVRSTENGSRKDFHEHGGPFSPPRFNQPSAESYGSSRCLHRQQLCAAVFKKVSNHMGKCPDPAGSVFITVQQSSLHVLKIAYKDEEELFTRFSDWLKALNVRIDNLYGLDRDWERIPINDPLHFFTLASGADVLNLYNKTASDDDNYCSKRNLPLKRDRSSNYGNAENFHKHGTTLSPSRFAGKSRHSCRCCRCCCHCYYHTSLCQ